jgi:hypothetical protein
VLGAVVAVLLPLAGTALAASPEAPETSPPDAIANTTATLHGIVNPATAASVRWYFAYRAGVSCEGGKVTSTNSTGEEPVEALPVQETISGLTPGTAYAICLVAESEAGEATVGNTVQFTTAANPPTVENETNVSIGSTTATVRAQINAEAEPTVYHLEYGLTSTYGMSTKVASLGGSASTVNATVVLTGLTPATTYHSRFVATSAFGTTIGPDRTFITARNGPPASFLPDARGYELVSVPLFAGEVNPGEAYGPVSPAGIPEDTLTELPFRAAADGDSVVYLAAPPIAGGNGGSGGGLGNQFQAVRAGAQWTTSVITPTQTADETAGQATGSVYESFSTDLSLGILSSASQPLAAAAQPAGPANCAALYAHTPDSPGLHALFGVSEAEGGGCGGPIFAGAAAGQLLFQTAAALIPGMTRGGSTGNRCTTECNLYDSIGGALSQVNLLPNGEGAPNATFGGPSDLSNVISQDGSRIYWTDVKTGVVYIRRNGITTSPVSNGQAEFWTATADGRYAFYIEGGDLWRFDADNPSNSRTELTGPGADVKGVLGASEDGSYVYVVAGGALTPDAVEGTCERAFESEDVLREQEGLVPPALGCNLYVLHAGQPEFIARLAALDNKIFLSGAESGGAWNPNLGSRTAEVSADGRHVVLESTQRLTGYDTTPLTGQGALEIFVFDADTKQLTCASCGPTGTPVADTGSELVNSYLPPSFSNTFMHRWMSDGGGRVFFDTSQPLVSQDANNKQDVYEWEQTGEGTCADAGGCIYLLSGGQSADFSYLVDASASGDNVFFTTRASLVPEDKDQRVDLYAARVGAESSEVSTCAAPCNVPNPAPSPIVSAPASLSFGGGGNVLQQASTPHKAKTKPLTRAQKLTRALTKCRHVPKRARRSCRKRAKAQFGPVRTERRGGTR